MNILVLYGPSGVGKTTVGKAFSEKTGWFFYDADADLLPEMRSCIAREETFSQALRDRYYQCVIDKIRDYSREHATLIVAQALIKQSNRDQLRQAFPQVKMVCLFCDKKILLARVQARANDVSERLAEKIWLEFEASRQDECLNNQSLPEMISSLEKFTREWGFIKSSSRS